MGNESLLKKEFQSRDVERIRNLVKKDYSAGTRQGTGYTKKEETRNEGDIWEENNKQWTIKNGVKQNVTKLDAAKKAIRVPLTCPKCGGSMKHWISKKMYNIHGVCFDCTIKYETDLKKAGLYSQYEKRMVEGNMKAFIRDIEQWALDNISKADTFVTEQGEIESWNNNNKQVADQVMSNIKEYTDQLKKHIRDEKITTSPDN